MADDFLLLLPIQRQQRWVEVEPRVERLFLDHLNPLEVFRPEQVRRKFCFCPNQIHDILDMICDEIKPETARSDAVPTIIKLCSALQFYASCSYLDVGDVMGLSEATIGRVVRDVTAELLRLQPHLHWPGNEEHRQIQTGFRAIASEWATWMSRCDQWAFGSSPVWHPYGA